MGRLWRKAPAVAVWTVLSLCLCLHSSPLSAACDQIQAGQTLRIRLLQPVSSYSAQPGMPIRAMVVESPQCDGLPYFELGTEVSGRVMSAHRVGLGFRHEAASLKLTFDWISPDVGPSSEMSTQVLSVDNARETVKNGVIHGITPESSPQERIFVPIPLGAAWNPYSYWMTPLFKAVFPIAPEPEIYFPAGTDLRLELTESLLIIDGMSTEPANPEFPESDRRSLDQLVAAFPRRSFNTKGLEADVVNLVFLGTEKQVADAFRTAGWVGSDPLSAHAILQEFHAVFAARNDPHLPMAHHLLNGRSAEFNLEKSLNSYAKRDHLRIWSSPGAWNGQSVWISASTAEVGATWSLRTKKFVHKVNPNIDEERRKIVRDLSVAGCVTAAYNAPRPGMPRVMLSSSGTELRTDGAVTVVQLTNCAAPVLYTTSNVGAPATRPPSKFDRFIRTEVLAVRNVWRDNPAYASYEVVRLAARAFPRDRDRNRRTELADAAAGATPADPAADPAPAPSPPSRLSRSRSPRNPSSLGRPLAAAPARAFSLRLDATTLPQPPHNVVIPRSPQRAVCVPVGSARRGIRRSPATAG